MQSPALDARKALFCCARKTRIHLSLLAACAAPALTPEARAEDWPHWRGPARTGISKETNWFGPWPDNGPRQVWKASVGTGFSSISVANGRAYTMGNQNDTDSVFCFDANTGKQLWKQSYRAKKDPKYYEGGASITPTADGSSVYALSRFGDLYCFDAATGQITWSRNIAKELGLAIPEWGFAGSPLVDGDNLILNVGKAGVALEKKTGKVIWSTGAEASGYSTPVPFTYNQQPYYAIFSAKSVRSVDPKTGKIVWEFPWETSYDVNAADPIVHGDKMFISSGYGKGGGLLDFAGNKPKAVWQSQEMHNHFNSCVLIDGHLYGVSGHDGRPSDVRCVEFATGKVKWKEASAGMGSLIAADGKLIILSDKGELIITEATPAAFKELSRAQVLGGRCWSTPVLANGKIYCRNAQGNLVCIETKPLAVN